MSTFNRLSPREVQLILDFLEFDLSAHLSSAPAAATAHDHQRLLRQLYGYHHHHHHTPQAPQAPQAHTPRTRFLFPNLAAHGDHPPRSHVHAFARWLSVTGPLRRVSLRGVKLSAAQVALVASNGHLCALDLTRCDVRNEGVRAIADAHCAHQKVALQQQQGDLKQQQQDLKQQQQQQQELKQQQQEDLKQQQQDLKQQQQEDLKQQELKQQKHDLKQQDLKQQLSLESLVLGENKLTVECLPALMSISTLRRLELPKNCISYLSSISRASYPGLPSALRHLDLSFNNVQGSVASLSAAFGGTLRFLSLTGNNIAGDSLAHFSMSKCPALRTLYVDGNALINDRQLAHFSHDDLVDLDLSRTGVSFVRACDKFASLASVVHVRMIELKTAPAEKEFHQQGVPLEKINNNALFTLLMYGSDFVTLNISDNDLTITKETAERLFTVPKKLKHLDVSGIQFDCDIPDSMPKTLTYLNMAKSIDLSKSVNAAKLADCPNLTYLNISDCCVNDALVIALAKSASLQELNLSANPRISANAVMAFQGNTVLQKLDVSFCGSCSRELKAHGNSDKLQIPNLFLGPAYEVPSDYESDTQLGDDEEEEEFEEFADFVDQQNLTDEQLDTLAEYQQDDYGEYDDDEGQQQQQHQQHQQQPVVQDRYFDPNTNIEYFFDPAARQWYYFDPYAGDYFYLDEPSSHQ